ncbi:hypothetical protein EC973_001900 [Apophysomyces ossiformis]|uniref:Phorbol-ester/DAG-type domain-containing protein n=1 Tax=Apophysomyces ossiformis TaxID=679940 RepID=A0A8H7BPI6_9FUNG|nr:hypothetical protein EC973_001900 [Apophysomyces ossiformis]
MAITHCFEETTFSRLTYCDRCKKLLWGITRQGIRCSACGYTCHDGCKTEAPGCPKFKEVPAYSAAASSLRVLEQQHNSVKQTIASKSIDPLTKLHRLATSEQFHNTLVAAAIHADDDTKPVNEYLANQPPLNPQLTTKNFTRFVARCGPFYGDLLHDMWVTFFSTFKHNALTPHLLGLYPKLIVFAPQLVLLNIVMEGYYKRYGYHPTPSPAAKNTSQSLTKQAPRPKPSRSTSSIQQNNQDSSKRGAFAFSFASALFPSDESSPEYLRNLQNLQNMMGETSDLYDAVAAQAHLFDWSNEEETLRLLQLLLLSTFVLSISIWFVPLNIVFLVGGISVFLSNTRFVKYVAKELLPSLLEYSQSQMDTVLEKYHDFEQQLQDHDRIQEISLYENQRWRPGRGFASKMDPGERAAWSDMLGIARLRPKEIIPPPKGYRWTEDSWRLDTTGPWVDDILGIEEDGWLYTDNNWEELKMGVTEGNTSPESNTPPKGVTRRRRWPKQKVKYGYFSDVFLMSEQSVDLVVDEELFAIKTLCKKLSSSQLARHKYRIHKSVIDITINGVPKEFNRDGNGFFTCDVCAVQVDETDNFKRHVQRHHGKMQKNGSYELDDDELVEDLAVSQPLLQRTAPSSASRRDAKTAILSAMHALQESKEMQQQKLFVAELGQLQLIGFIRNDFEYNLLADGNTISTILEIEDPAYHGRIEAVSISEITLLPEHIAIAPFQKLIANNYVEMNDDLSVILNTDWNRYPWLRYVCARMMERALFLDHGKGIMVGCAEIYGRTPENDAHHEKFKPTMTQIFPSSLPQPFTRYTNIEIKIIQNDSSSKLVLGFETIERSHHIIDSY